MRLCHTALNELRDLAVTYEIPFEDALFIDFNRKGLACDLDYPRVRFYFELARHDYLDQSVANDIMQYFLALPTNSGISDYTLVGDEIRFNDDVVIGNVQDLVDDSIDAAYPRREATVMNLNPSVKSACRGCDFCYVNLLTANDQAAAAEDQETFLHYQAQKWMDTYFLDDLSTLTQVAVLTGCFGGEDQAINSMMNIYNVFSDYGFDGEIFFFGSEIASTEGLDRIQDIDPFALCLTIENFRSREDMLKGHKERLTLPEAKSLLKHANKNGFSTQFSYVLGLESLETVVAQMEEFESYVNRMPIINIFQPHSPDDAELLHDDATDLEYYLQARKELERIFDPADYVPRPWENYRSLWYLKYADHLLTGPRVPEALDGPRMDDQLPP